MFVRADYSGYSLALVRDLPGTYNSDQYVWVPKRDQLKKIAAEKGINEESFKALKRSKVLLFLKKKHDSCT